MIAPALITELTNESKRIEEDALFSGRGHYNAIAPWRTGHRILGVTSALGSALAGVVVLKQWAPGVAIVAAAASTIAAVILTTLKPNDEADRHQRAGDRYFAVKNRARIFRCVELIAAAAHEEPLVEGIKTLSAELDATRSTAPGIPRRAYERAKRDIEVEKHAEYKVDKPAP